MELYKIELRMKMENELLQLRSQLNLNPLNRTIKGHIKRYEACLQQYYSQTIAPSVTITQKEEPKKEEPKKEEPAKKKKKAISATIKKLVWNTNIGEDIGKSKCMCCKSTDITQMSFNCGHVIAEANGGDTIVSNLKPICQNCNSSMGTKNMNNFMLTLK